MPTVEAKKRASEKYNKSIFTVRFDLKNTEDTALLLKDIVEKYNTKNNAFAKACLKYCIDNNIDISAYL